MDGIQAIGMVQCDVHNLNIDFLSAGGHKWLLALPGAGFFYCRKELLDELEFMTEKDYRDREEAMKQLKDGKAVDWEDYKQKRGIQ